MSNLPPWMDSSKAKKKKINARSARQEKKYAKESGGKVQPGSGSSPRAPEDVVEPVGPDGEGDLVQLKYTDAKGFRITVAEWKRLRANARRVGRSPKLVIDFESEGIRLVVREEAGSRTRS